MKTMGFPGGSVAKESAYMQETPVPSLGWEDPLQKEMATHSSLLARKSRRQKSLVGYSLWGHKVLGTAEWLNHHHQQRT